MPTTTTATPTTTTTPAPTTSTTTTTTTTPAATTSTTSTTTSTSTTTTAPPDEWKAWPGGQFETNLNPLETLSSTDFGLTGNVDWNVGNGSVPAVITQTGTETAQNLAQITVRYDSGSPTSAEADTVWVEATSGGQTVRKKRTVFRAVCIRLKYDGDLDPDNNLQFPDDTGTGDYLEECGFVWEGEKGATRAAAKMEATWQFFPTGIIWSARGVTWGYSASPNPNKFGCRLNRLCIQQGVAQLNAQNTRSVLENDSTWVTDGESNSDDAQNPTDSDPDYAFRLDAPGFKPSLFKQCAQRVDLRETVEWNNGNGYHIITNPLNGLWYASVTAVLPNGAQGGDNSHGDGAAGNIPNSEPVANAGNNQTVSTGANVQLSAAGSTDADNDLLAFKWTQTDGTTVTLSPSDTSKVPTFTAPNAATVIKFRVNVSDICKGLHHHQPSNYEDSAEVTITVQ